VTGVYDIIDIVKEELLTDGICKSVSVGDLSESALQKLTAYPYAHVVLGTADFEDNIITFNINIICMDVVDVSKSDITDLAKGNDNEHDALNTTLGILSRVVERFKRSDIRLSGYDLAATPSAEPFFDDFADKVAGWNLSIAISWRNNMAQC
jgi:hypothetical protein